jgi:NitT/TauT family transport system ATP-binding protein
MSAAITAHGVVKVFQHQVVLQDLDLEIQPSEIACLIGPSGCGKSTLLRLLSGLERDFGGSLRIAGRDVSGPSPAVGVMFQEPRLLPWLSVRDNVALGLPPAKRRNGGDLVRRLLAQVHLEGVGDALPRRLSGGMAQRVALARALVNDPQLLVLDEPLGKLDSLTRIAMQSELVNLWQRAGFSALLVTHDVEEALFLANRVIVLSDRPARIAAEIVVDLPYPRHRGDARLAALRHEALKHLGLDATW